MKHHFVQTTLTRTAIRFAVALVTLLTLLHFTAQRAAAIVYRHATQAVWVFPSPTQPNPVTDSTARQKLITNATASGVDILYLSIYSGTANTAGRQMYDDGAIAAFITQAHSSNIRVYAAYGAPDWPSLGTAPDSFPLKRMAEVVAYNLANPLAKLDGVVLDIEPPEDQTTSDFQALLTQYQSIRQALPHDLALSIAIRFFWNSMVEFPVGSGVSKKVYEHIIDLAAYDYNAGFQPIQNVIVMGYRNFAGTANGVISLDQDEIAYAKSQGLTNQLILVGLETLDPVAANLEATVSLFPYGQAVLNSVAATVLDRVGFFNGMGGFAIHNYNNSYLSGTNSNWPAINPGFPFRGGPAQEGTTPTGSNVTVPVGTIGDAVINISFPNVSTAGFSYVRVIDPSAAGQLPNGYQLNENLAFEIVTTATFTGTVTISFQVPSVDPATFSTLRVLHNTGNGLIDQTAANPPPNAATQTIYANVTSFSPFVLAHVTVTFDSLIALTRRYVTQPRIANELAAALMAAKVAQAKGLPKMKALAIDLYVKGVTYISGKAITPANAATLISLARQL